MPLHLHATFRRSAQEILAHKVPIVARNRFRARSGSAWHAGKKSKQGTGSGIEVRLSLRAVPDRVQCSRTADGGTLANVSGFHPRHDPSRHFGLDEGNPVSANRDRLRKLAAADAAVKIGLRDADALQDGAERDQSIRHAATPIGSYRYAD